MEQQLPTQQNIKQLIEQLLPATETAVVDEPLLDELVLVWNEQGTSEEVPAEAQDKDYTKRSIAKWQLLKNNIRSYSEKAVNPEHQSHRNRLIGAICVLGLVAGAWLLSRESGNERAIMDAKNSSPSVPVVVLNEAVPTTYNTTTTLPERTDIVLSLPNDVQTTVTEVVVDTTAESIETVPPTTVLPIETTAATLLPVEDIATQTTVESMPPTTAIDLYSQVDCNQKTTVILRGMTPSELAGHCGMSIEKLQTYNSFNVLTEFITGTIINLQSTNSSPSVGPNTSSQKCPTWLGQWQTIADGFTVFNYLQSLGIQNPTRLIADTTLLQDYNLQKPIVGNRTCLPTAEALRIRYGI